MPTTAISKTRRQVYKDWCDAVDAARTKGGEDIWLLIMGSIEKRLEKVGLDYEGKPVDRRATINLCKEVHAVCRRFESEMRDEVQSRDNALLEAQEKLRLAQKEIAELNNQLRVRAVKQEAESFGVLSAVQTQRLVDVARH